MFRRVAMDVATPSRVRWIGQCDWQRFITRRGVVADDVAHRDAASLSCLKLPVAR